MAKHPGSRVPKGLGDLLRNPGAFGSDALFVISGALELLFWEGGVEQECSVIGDCGCPLQIDVGESPVGNSERTDCELGIKGRAKSAALSFFVMITGALPPQ